MKKILSILACFCFLLVGGVLLTACGEPKLTGITLDTQDAHIAFITGEEFNTTGLKVKGVYDNKSEKELAQKDYEKVTAEAVKGQTTVAEGSEFVEAGTYTVNVSYEYEDGKFFKNTYDITVAEPELTGIQLDTQGADTAFLVGENFTTTGLKVKGVYENDSKKDLAQADYQKVTAEAVKGETKVAVGAAFSEVGTYTVTVSYEYEEGKFFKDTYNVTVTYLNEESGVALVGSEADLEKAIEHYSAAKLNGDVVLTKQIEVAKTFTLDLGGHTIKNETPIWNGSQDKLALISVEENGKLTVEGTGEMTALKDDCWVFVVKGGELTIKDGKFNGNADAVYVRTGTLIVEGGEFDMQQLSDGHSDKRYLLNCEDAYYKNGTAHIIVRGGIFHGFNPANNKAESLTGGINFVDDGYKVEKTTDNADEKLQVWTVSEAENYRYAKDVDTLTAALKHDNSYVVLTSDITLDTAKIFKVTNKNVTLDLAGHKISNTVDVWSNDGEEGYGENDRWSLVSVRDGGELTVTGNGTFDAKQDDVYALDVYGGTLTIENGTFKGNVHAVYVHHGICTINDGEFDIKQTTNGNKNFLLNCLNANAQNGTANIIVKGGKFHGFNPDELKNDDGKESYVAEGFYAEESSDTYTVKAYTDGNVHVKTAESFRTALTAAKTQTVVLDSDITFDGKYIQLENAKSQITLDLNGHTLTTNYSAIFIVFNAKLTIKDSKENGKFVSKSNTLALINVGSQLFMEPERAGHLVIESGVFETKAPIVLVNNGTVEIANGKFTSTNDSGKWTLNIYDEANETQAKIEVSGGEFTGFNPEHPNTNDRQSYLKDGYKSQVKGGNGNVYEVVEKQD